MRITDSNITFASARRYTEQGLNYRRGEQSGTVMNDIFAARDVTPSAGGDLHSELIGLRDALLQELLRRMLSSGLFGAHHTTFGAFGRAAGLSGPLFPGTGSGFTAAAGSLSFTQTTYAEEETTGFLAHGMAKTDDGRTIDFDINLLMSRSFVQYTQINVPMFSDALFDPLMINTGAAIANLKDQTFRFDLDMDGEEDNIALPAEGTGFLALDLNGDGTVNDGSELFGVKSGNGFSDLAAYDSDGNGWIDENDDVYARLKVWYKNGDGSESLVDLKAADVGAIYLGNAATDFSLYGNSLQLNGAIRATGMFLKESGGAGTIQHVDLAKQRTPSDGASLTEASPGDAVFLSGTPANAGSDYVPETGDTASVNGALVINTAGTQEQTEDAASMRRTENRPPESAREKRTAQRQKKAEQEAVRKQAQQKRRAEKEALNKEAAARLQQRRELRKEQLDALFEERAEQKEAMDELLVQRMEEHDALDKALRHDMQTAGMIGDQIISVA